MASEPSSVITRSWKATINYLIMAGAGAVLSGLLFWWIASGPVTVGIALIPAVVAVIFLFMAMSGAGTCACPGCGAELSGLSTGSNDGVLCGQCHRYFEGKEGKLWATDESRVADTPQFASPLPEPFAFPEGCCVCGQPAARRDKISLQTMNASSAITANALPGVSVTSYSRTSIEVPHCEQHKDGASLTGTQQQPHIRFRSYPYLRAFCELNKTTPG